MTVNRRPSDLPPLGKRVRDVLNPILKRPDSQQKMQQHVSETLEQLAQAIPQLLEQKLTPFFRTAAIPNAETRANKILRGIVLRGGDDDTDAFSGANAGPFMIVATLQLPVMTDFLKISRADLAEMPGYIALHSMARDLDAAVSVSGLIDETNGRFAARPVTVEINLAKSYKDGLRLSGEPIPELPPLPFAPDAGNDDDDDDIPPPKKKLGGDFDMD